MVLPLIGSILAPTLLGGTGFLAGTGLGFLGTGAGLAGLGAGLGSLAQGDDLETALGTRSYIWSYSRRGRQASGWSRR